MSKIVFDDKSYIQAKKNDNEKIIIVISAKDQSNKKITNAVEISEEQFKELISDIQF